MEAWLPSEPRAASTARSELRARVVSSLVLIPAALAAGIMGGLPFALVVAAFGAIALWEWTAMAGASEPVWLRPAAATCLVAGLLALLFFWAAWPLALIAVPALAMLALGSRRPSFLWTGLGLLYVGVPCAAFILLREAEPSGWAAVLFILLVVWATDIGAYFGGRSIGGPKLWPRISPKKTWSGALTGMFTACVTGGLTVWLTRTGGAAMGVLLAVPLSAASQAGDLFESAMKRRFGVKDSGHIIPGHGGVLDRVDGLFAAAALAWLIAGTGLGGELLQLPRENDVVAEAAS
jgi:phosphatidate cytidylyltransferase